MKYIFSLLLMAILSVLEAYAQRVETFFDPNTNYSISAGYGTGGFAIRGDIGLKAVNVPDPLASGRFKFYMELAFKPVTFEEKTFVFNKHKYPSDVRTTALGAGFGFDAKYGRWSIYPFLGVRAYYVRFTDQTLVDAIGTNGLVRYMPDEYGNNFQVGPEVKNAYGDAFTFDIGGSMGYHVTPTLEMGALLGYSAVKFSTPGTLFGEYWGEPPYKNEYYVKILPLRGEMRLRFNF